MENCYAAIEANGLLLRQVRGASFQSIMFPGTGVALDADNTNYSLVFDNCFFQTASTVTTTGMTKTYDSGQSTLGGTINHRVIYDVPSAAVEAHTMINATVSGRMKIPVVLTASLPAAAAAQDNMILIEDGGVGDRNVIIYAGGQRFRIDGGAAI